MPPKGASPRLQQHKLLGSLLRLASQDVAAKWDAAALRSLPDGELCELEQEKRSACSLVRDAKPATWDAVFQALERSPEARVALAQLLSATLRTCTLRSPGASPQLAATPTAELQSGAINNCAANKAGARLMRLAQGTLIFAVSVANWYMRAAGLHCLGGELPAGAASFVEALLRADFLTAVAQYSSAARGCPTPRPEHMDPPTVRLVSRLGRTISSAAAASPKHSSLILSSLCKSDCVELWVQDAAEGMQDEEGACGSKLRNLLEQIYQECSTGKAAFDRLRSLCSGPRLRYWLGLQAVSQLHAADGGTLYGLPPAVLLPPIWVEEKKQAQEVQQQRARGGSPGQPQRRFLGCGSVSSSLEAWAWLLEHDGVELMAPLRPRGLLSLTLRAAHAALASCELHDPGLAGAVEAVRRGSGQQGRQQQQQRQDMGSVDGASCRNSCGRYSGCGGSSNNGGCSSSRVWPSGGSGSGSSPTASGPGGCSSGGGGFSGCQSFRSGAMQHYFEAAGCSTLALTALLEARDALAAAICHKHSGSCAESGVGSSSSSGDGDAAAITGESSSCPSSGCSSMSSTDGGGGGTSAGMLGAGASSSPAQGASHAPGGRLHLARFAFRWWPLVVRAVWAAMRRPGGLTLVDGYCSGVILPVVQPWEPRGGGKDLELPSSPPPGLSTALAAGLIPTIEAYLRTIARPCSTASSPCSSDPSTSSPSSSSPASTTAASPVYSNIIHASGHAVDLFARLSDQNLALLLAYGDPVQGAALLTTVAKAALCHAEASARAGYTAGVNRVTCRTLGVLINISAALNSESEDSASTAGPESACAASSAPVGGGPTAPAVSQAPGATAACQHSPAKEQLKQLLWFAAPRWLPVLERLHALCEPIGDPRIWGPRVGHFRDHLRQLLGGATAACRAAWEAGDVRAVASWRQLLQRDVCVRDWVGGDVLGTWEAEAWWADTPPQQPHSLAGGMAITEGLATGGGGDPTAAAASIGGASRYPWVFMMALAPCEAASLLPTCSNSLCTALEGDTEAGLGLTVVEAETASLSAGAGTRAGVTASGSAAGAEPGAGEGHEAESMTPAAKGKGKGKGKRKGKGAGKGKGAEAGAATKKVGAAELGSGVGPGSCFRYCSVACRTAHVQQQRLNLAKLRRP